MAASRNAHDAPETRIAVIDDITMNRNGTTMSLERLPGVSVTESLNFRQALARDDWSDIDWVVIDVVDEDEEIDAVPSIEVIRHIKPNPDVRRPRVIAVTTKDSAWSEPLIQLHLEQVGAEFYMLRKDLDRHLETALAKEEADAREVLDTLPEPPPLPDMEADGVTSATVMNGFTDVIKSEPVLLGVVEGEHQQHGDRRYESLLTKLRVRLEAASHLKPRTKDGGPPRRGEQREPGIPQITWTWRRRSLWTVRQERRATRPDDHHA